MSTLGSTTRRLVLRRLVLPLAVLAGMNLVPPAAQADSRAESVTTVVKVETAVAKSDVNTDVAPAAVCGVPVKRGAYTGAALCGTTILDVTYSNGIQETFVVGTTSRNNIYHIWQRYVGDTQWIGWRTLPGNGTAVDGIWDFTLAPRLVVFVLGTTGLYYCNERGTTGGWSGWYVC